MFDSGSETLAQLKEVQPCQHCQQCAKKNSLCSTVMQDEACKILYLETQVTTGVGSISAEALR